MRSNGQLVNGRTLLCSSPECELFLGIIVQQEVPECLRSNPGSLADQLLILGHQSFFETQFLLCEAQMASTVSDCYRDLMR